MAVMIGKDDKLLLLLIRRKGEKDSEHDPIRKMLEDIDAGYSLILFPEGTRGKPEQMGKIKSGIARILSLRPEVKYIPVFMCIRALNQSGHTIIDRCFVWQQDHLSFG